MGGIFLGRDILGNWPNMRGYHVTEIRPGNIFEGIFSISLSFLCYMLVARVLCRDDTDVTNVTFSPGHSLEMRKRTWNPLPKDLAENCRKATDQPEFRPTGSSRAENTA